MRWRVTAPDGTRLSVEGASQAEAIALGKRQHAQALPPSVTAPSVAPTTSPLTTLSPRDESRFRSWYSSYQKKLGFSPDPDDPRHFYDWRAAFQAGATPNAEGHWPSQFKLPGHPNQFVGGIDTRTGLPESAAQVASTPATPLLAMAGQPSSPQPLLEEGPPTPFWQRAKELVGKKAGPIPEFFTPGSWTEAGIQAALVASPFVGKALGVALPSVVAGAPALARWLTRGARVGLTAAGGAAGGAVGGEGMGRGALTGAETAATGELLATPLQWISRSAAGPMMQRLDAKRLSRVLSEIVPDLPRVTSPAELHKLVMGTAGGELLGQALERDLQPVLRATKGVAFRFPALEEALNKPFWPTTFEGALEELRKIGYRGYSMTGDPRGAITAIAARQLRHELRRQMTDALRNPAKYAAPIASTPSFRGIRSPKTAQAFDDAMQRYARGREAVDLLADSRVWEGGRLNMRALQELAGTEEYRSISGTLKDDAARLYGAIYRGGTALGRDVPEAVGVHVRLYPRAGIPHASVSMPRFPNYTGLAPGVTRKGASFAPVTSLAALGLFGGPEEPDEQPPPVSQSRGR